MNTLRRVWRYLKSIKQLRDWRYWALVFVAAIITSPISSGFIRLPLLIVLCIGISYGLEEYDKRKNK